MQNGIVGRLLVEITANMDGLQSGLQKAEKASENSQNKMQNSWTTAAQKMNSIGNKLTLGVTAPLVAGGLAAIKYASDLEETSQKVDVVFGKSADSVKEWAGTAVEQMGLAKEPAMSAASTYGNMADGMRIASDTGLEMAMSLTQLSADLASFNNTSQETARIALNSVFTGETETLKQYGIVMTQTNLQQFAMQQGITKNIQSMTQAEQVQLRYNYVLANTTNAQGDFARTSDSVANQTRMAKEQFKEAAAMLGQNLLPAATGILKTVNGMLKGFNSLDKGTQKLIITLGGIAIAAGPVMKIGSGAITTVQKLYSAVQKFKKPVEELPKTLNKTSSLVDEFGNSLTYTQTAAQNAGTAIPTIGKGAKAAEPGVKSFGTTLNSALGIIGLVGAAATTLIAVFSELSKPSEEAQALKDNTDGLIESLNKSAAEFENSTAKIDAQATMANTLAGEIESLNNGIITMNEADGASAAQKELLKQKANELNSVLGKTVVTINDQTGAINENVGSIYDAIEAYTKQAQTQAFLERYNSLLSDMNNLQIDNAVATKKVKEGFESMHPALQEDVKLAYQLRGASGALEELAAVTNDNDLRAYAITVRESQDALAGAEDEMAAFKAAAKDLGIDIDSLIISTQGESEALETLSAATKQITEDEATLFMQRQENGEKLNEEDAANLELWKANNAERAEVLEEEVKREAELYQKRVDAATNMNDKIDLSNQVSLKKAAENLEYNTQVTQNMVANLDSLYGKIPESLYTYLEEAGTDQAKLISQLADEMEGGGSEVAERFVNAYLAALNAGKSPAEAASYAFGSDTQTASGKGVADNTALQAETVNQMDDTIQSMRGIIDGGNFYYLGMGIINDMARGMRTVSGNLYSEADRIMDSLKSRLSVTIEAATTASGAKIRAYDVGGYFNRPQLIQIAEKRPEFVGAADDLESFISKAVNNAFIGVDPIVTQPLPNMNLGNSGTGDMQINVSMPVTVKGKMTDAEINRMMDKMVYTVRKKVGRLMN